MAEALRKLGFYDEVSSVKIEPFVCVVTSWMEVKIGSGHF